MTTPAASVVMPVFNAGAYLDAAVESVLAQTHRDFELILVDDGSTDGSAARCDAFAARDPRVRVLHQANGGISAARNAGLDAARGAYVGFADHDDAFLPTLLATAHDAARAHDADAVKFGYRVEETFANGTVDHRVEAAAKPSVVTGERLADAYAAVKASGAFQMVWNGLYRRAFLERHGLRFDARCRYGYEDWIFNADLYPRLGTLALLPDVLYVHFQRTGVSTSKRYHENQVLSCALAAEREVRMLDAIGIGRISPAERPVAVAVALVEILRRLADPGCPLSLAEKAARLRAVRREPPFDAAPDASAMRTLRTASAPRALVARLFFAGRMRTLALLAEAYFRFLSLRKGRG